MDVTSALKPSLEGGGKGTLCNSLNKRDELSEVQDGWVLKGLGCPTAEAGGQKVTSWDQEIRDQEVRDQEVRDREVRGPSLRPQARSKDRRAGNG